MHLDVKILCNTPEKLAKGLMFSSPLDINSCAFFVFQYLDSHSFWNKNVDFPISLFFLDENFKIQEIGELKEQQETPYSPKYPLIKYVVEGHVDLPKELNIKIGDFFLPENNKLKILTREAKNN
jgi:uncharacterized membrane protein (UPF0127 family)